METPIVFATDDNYILPLSVAIQSLKNHKKASSKYIIYIFYETLSQINIKNISSLSEEGVLIEFVDVSKEFEKLNFSNKGYWSRATYCRLFAPLVLKKYTKILYFDCDMIIRCDLQDLYKIPLQNNILAGVKDVFFNQEDYINAGFLMINIEQYNNNNICSKCLDSLIFNDLKYLDQDALNYACQGKKLILPYNYNFLSSSGLESTFHLRQQKINKIKDIAVLHYVTDKKPWNYKNFPFANLWWKEAKKLPKQLKKELNDKYLSKIDKRKFNYKFYRYHFGSKLYKFWVKSITKIKGIFQK